MNTILDSGKRSKIRRKISKKLKEVYIRIPEKDKLLYYIFILYLNQCECL